MDRLRLRQFHQLVGFLLRVMQWRGIAIGWMFAAGLAVSMTWRGSESNGLGALRMVTVALCAACASVFDDAANETIASSPTSLPHRRAYRILILAGPLVALAAVAFLFVSWRTGQDLAAGVFWLEFAVLAAATLAVAAIAAHLGGEERTGIVAAPLLLTIVGLSFTLPMKWEFLFVLSGEAEQASRHRIIAALAAGVVVAIWLSRDPGRRRVNRSRLRRRQEGVRITRGEGVPDGIGGS